MIRKRRDRLHGLGAVGDLDQLAGGDVGIGEGAELDEFHPVSPAYDQLASVYRDAKGFIAGFRRAFRMTRRRLEYRS
jgi:hypothetical protein